MHEILASAKNISKHTKFQRLMKITAENSGVYTNLGGLEKFRRKI
jgi:hypothetical protein